MELFGSDDAPADLSGEEIGTLSSQTVNRAETLRRVVDEEAGVVLYHVLADDAAGLTAVPIDRTDLEVPPAEDD